MRLPPRGVVRFLGWHVLKLEFWHFAHPKLNLGFVFASVFAVFSSKKTPQPARCTVQKHAQLSISHRFCSVFSCVSHFASVFAVFLPTLDFLHMPDHAGFDLRLSFSSVRGWGGVWGEGVITSMRMRLVSSVFCCCFLCVAFRIIAFLLKHRPCKNLAFLQLSRQKNRKRRKKST